MDLTAADRLAIHELLARHGHLVDEGELDRLDEVMVDDVRYDVTALGGGVLVGVAAIVAAGRELGDANPVAHHVTNVIITSVGDERVQVRSKGFGVRADGTVGSVVYEDDVVRVADGGWRIAARRVLPRRAPLTRSAAELADQAQDLEVQPHDRDE
jgi:3-phenylpropionate/cinnamic acid dioxygenase small subunit